MKTIVPSIESNSHYDLIVDAIQCLVENQKTRPSPCALSRHLGVSEFHLQRIFSEWVGISQKQFLQYLTKEYAKMILNNKNILETSLECGLSGSSRLHDLMISWEGVTPGEYKKLGKNLHITSGVCATPFGACYIARTTNGICKFAFYNSEIELKFIEKELYQDWPQAKIFRNDGEISILAQDIFINKPSMHKPLKLLLRGSRFQIKVWEALLSIPHADLVSYQEIATAIHNPKAVRAVATAVANNKIAYLIPCHRVIRQNGDFGQYRWNKYRKQLLIAWEASLKLKD